jgi:hypothetical protein
MQQHSSKNINVLNRIIKHLNKSILLILVWVLSLILWLFYGYKLEMEGKNTFINMWISSLLFHTISVINIIGIIKIIY